jgi:hypothetical protein
MAGEYLVAGQLSLKGFVASLTLKNYPKVDIFCLNPKNGRQVAIQVKTIRGGRLYYVPESVDNDDNPFVFVYIHDDEKVDYFILPSADVARLSKFERDEYIRIHPLGKPEQPRMISIHSLQEYRDRWDLLNLVE